VGRDEPPVTPATRLLRAKGVPFAPHLYPFEARDVARHAAQALGVQEHAVIKTLVMAADPKRPFLVLMHGDCEVSTKALARLLDVKEVAPLSREEAERATGYQVGGISPLGTRRPMTVYAEATIFDLPVIYLNGGRRGFLVALDPDALRALLSPIEVYVAQTG
jgi:Cys-tRNA(Pro) deacylase